jgi:UDP-2,4-diacetamido-2,4,6-trideoxy-beta-L-altropyranose hydrolase
MTLSAEMFIRADGNSSIGFGHLMRALAFANHAKSISKVSLVIRNPDQIAQEACLHYDIQLLDISHISPEEEAFYLGKLAGKGKIVFLDGYSFDALYQQQVKQSGCFLVCMDDHHDRMFLADCIINVAELEDPAKVLRKISSRLVYGLKYALIRPEFSINSQDTAKLNQVFVCFGGGAETLPLIEKTLQALSLSNLVLERIVVVLNEKLIPQVNEFHTSKFAELPLELLSNLSSSNIASLISNSRIGICSSSTVSLECRALGLPIISGYFVANQKGIYNSLIKNHEIPLLGNLQEISAELLANSIVNLWNNCQDYAKSVLHPDQIKRQYQRFIQSWLVEMEFSIRKAAADDVELYLDWANQPDVRLNAINSDPIIPENHRKWFASRIQSDTTKLFVGVWNGKPVGQIRFDLHNEAWEIDYSVDANFRNMGIGELLIRKGMQELFNEIGENLLVVGLVKFNNLPSAEVFKKMHFSENQTETRSGIELSSFSYRLSSQLLSL